MVHLIALCKSYMLKKLDCKSVMFIKWIRYIFGRYILLSKPVTVTVPFTVNYRHHLFKHTTRPQCNCTNENIITGQEIVYIRWNINGLVQGCGNSNALVKDSTQPSVSIVHIFYQYNIPIKSTCGTIVTCIIHRASGLNSQHEIIYKKFKNSFLINAHCTWYQAIFL